MAAEEGQEGQEAEGQERGIYAGGAVPLTLALSRPIIQIVAMTMTMATNCSSTRSRISFCDVLGEPPRIMLMRPSTSTIATAPIAMGTMILRHELTHADADSTARPSKLPRPAGAA